MLMLEMNVQVKLRHLILDLSHSIMSDHLMNSLLEIFLILKRQVKVSEVHGTQIWVSSVSCNSMLNRPGILWQCQCVSIRYVHIEIIFVHSIRHKMTTR